MKPISTAYLSLCVYVYLPIVARLRLGKHVLAATIEELLGRVVFYAISIVSKESKQFFPELLVSFADLGVRVITHTHTHTKQILRS
jgi:hypothetical protein